MTDDPSATPPIRILTVDDHPLMRCGIASVVDGQPGMRVVAEAAHGGEGVEQCLAHRPDVTLMDVQMPVMNGIDATIAIRRAWPEARIVVLTTSADDFERRGAVQAGAAAFLLKSVLRRDLVATIRAVHAGHRAPAESFARERPRLSVRELEVLRQVAAGCSNKRIAAQLGATEDIVKIHVKAILGKLSASDRTHAVTLAVRHGILEL